VHNLLCDESEEPYFERTTLSDFLISEEGRVQLLALLKEDGAEFINELDRWVSGKEEEILEPNGRRYGVTMFFFDGGVSLVPEHQFGSVDSGTAN
jgi:hypothetical protein